MNRKKILAVVKELDESGVYPYLHDVLTDGSATSENWLNDLEERNLKNETELVNSLVEMRIV
jgi:hypothetical protein